MASIPGILEDAARLIVDEEYLRGTIEHSLAEYQRDLEEYLQAAYEDWLAEIVREDAGEAVS